MHPLFQSWKLLLLYVAIWVAVGATLGLLISSAGPLSPAETAAIICPVTVVMGLVCLSPWYVCRTLPLRSAGPARLLIQNLLATMVVAASVLLVAHLAASGFSGVFPELDRRFETAEPILSAMVAMLYLLSIAVHYVLIEAQTSRRSELLAREAQWRALKAQVNPHFLFNSLNSISALTASDSGRAREMCLRLASFLRTSLRLGERPSIPFREEM